MVYEIESFNMNKKVVDNIHMHEYVNFVLQFVCNNKIKNYIYKRLDSSCLVREVLNNNYALKIIPINNNEVNVLVHFPIYTSVFKFDIINDVDIAKKEFITDIIKEEGL